MNEISASKAAANTEASPHLYGTETLEGCAPDRILILGMDLQNSGPVRLLREQYPGAHEVSLAARLNGGESVHWKRLAALRRRRYQRIIVTDNRRDLQLFALGIPAQQRLLLVGYRLEFFGIIDVLRKLVVARVQPLINAWFSAQVPAPIGAGNDYSFIEERIVGLEADWPRLKVSVIVPVYNRREILAKTLSGLRLQDYPRELFEVIIADDGSSDHPEALLAELMERPDFGLDLKLVRQEDEGYRLCAVRNLAIDAAEGDIIVCLDCDMLPAPGWLRSMVRWFHVYEKPLVVIGYRENINSDDLSAADVLDDFGVVERCARVPAPKASRETADPSADWRLRIFESSRMLKTHRAPFDLASGGNVAYRRADAIEVGLHDAEFDRWGGEDGEFGYRMLRRGAYFIPEPAALAYHQDHPDSVDREEDRKISDQILARKVPHHRHGAATQDATQEWEAPKVSVYIPAYNAAEWIETAVESALNQTLKDLEVCICNDGSSDETLEVLQKRYRDHPRVHWINQNNGGTSSASTTAIALCRGEYILQLDADDELIPEAAAVLAAELDRDTALSLVYAGREEFGIRDRVIIPKRYSRYEHLVSNVVSHPRMFRARDYHRSGGFDHGFPSAEDFDLTLKLAEHGAVRSIPRALYRYRVHEQSKSIARAERQGRYHYQATGNALARLGLPWVMSPLDIARPGVVQLSHPRGLSAARRPRPREIWLAGIDSLRSELVRRLRRITAGLRS